MNAQITSATSAAATAITRAAHAATLAQVRVRRIPAAADTRWFGPAEVQFGSQSSPALLRTAEPPDREQRAREQSPEYRLWRAIFVAIYDDVRAEGPNGPTMLEVGQAELLRELEEVAGCIGDLFTSPWGFNGWYDLNEDDLKPHGFTWGINIPLDGDPCAAVACGEAMLGEELP